MVVYAKDLATKIKTEVAKQILDLTTPPVLAIIQVGNDPASDIYVRNKNKDCSDCGIICREYKLDAATNTDTIIELITELNMAIDVDGILVQLPLPKHIDSDAVLNSISVRKDVDCFHPVNVGRLHLNDYRFVPCTPAGVIEYLHYNNIDLAGKHCVVIGRSNIVGKPLATMLTDLDATVTLCHSKTKNLADITKLADIIICAVGKAKFLTEDMIKECAVVIDVGINRDTEGNLCGDVDFESVKDKTTLLTPVPGGIGLLTRAKLMENVLYAARYNM